MKGITVDFESKSINITDEDAIEPEGYEFLLSMDARGFKILKEGADKQAKKGPKKDKHYYRSLLETDEQRQEYDAIYAGTDDPLEAYRKARKYAEQVAGK